jgi:hypothetical protein
LACHKNCFQRLCEWWAPKTWVTLGHSQVLATK